MLPADLGGVCVCVCVCVDGGGGGGVEPATSWFPVGRRIQLSRRGRPSVGIISVDVFKVSDAHEKIKTLKFRDFHAI